MNEKKFGFIIVKPVHHREVTDEKIEKPGFPLAELTQKSHMLTAAAGIFAFNNGTPLAPPVHSYTTPFTFAFVGSIDNYESCVWNHLAFEADDVEIRCQYTDELAANLKAGYFLIRKGTVMPSNKYEIYDYPSNALYITEISISKDDAGTKSMTIRASGLSILLKKRVISGGFSAPDMDGVWILDLLAQTNAGRASGNDRMLFNRIMTNAKGIHTGCTVTVENDNLYDYIVSNCKKYDVRLSDYMTYPAVLDEEMKWNYIVTYERGVPTGYSDMISLDMHYYGFKFDPTPKYDGEGMYLVNIQGCNLQFLKTRELCIDPSKDDGTINDYSKNAVVFSTSNGSLQDYSYVNSVAPGTFYNAAYIKGTSEKQGTIRTYVSHAYNTLDRSEKYIDYTDSTDKSLSATDFKVALQQYAMAHLSKYTTAIDASLGQNIPYEYGTDYLEGDVVTVACDGFSSKMRIASVTESDDSSGYKCVPVFGNEDQDTDAE